MFCDCHVRKRTDRDIFDALLATCKKCDRTCELITKKGFEFNADNSISIGSELGSDNSFCKEIDKCVSQILYLHSIIRLWSGRIALETVAQKIMLIAGFNLAMNEMISIAAEAYAV